MFELNRLPKEFLLERRRARVLRASDAMMSPAPSSCQWFTPTLNRQK